MFLKTILLSILISHQTRAIYKDMDNGDSIDNSEAGNELFRPEPLSVTQSQLVNQLRLYNNIKTNKVAIAMAKVDRHTFIPHPRCYEDLERDAGYGTTAHPPHMQAYVLETLRYPLLLGKSALDVGSGNGYLTVCMAEMLGENGRVVGVEHIPELVTYSEKCINKHNPKLLKSGRITIKLGDGREGVPELAPYDAIYVGAVASEVPPALMDQLNFGGRMLIAIASNASEKYYYTLVVIDKLANGTVRVDERYEVYEPLDLLCSYNRTAVNILHQRSLKEANQTDGQIINQLPHHATMKLEHHTTPFARDGATPAPT